MAERPCERYLRQTGAERGISRAQPTSSGEIDEQFGLVRSGATVVDLGCAPGAWSQYVRRRLSPEGLPQGAQRRHHRAGHPAHGAHRRRHLPAGRLPRSRCWRNSRMPCKAARWMWWCRTWRPTFRGSHRPTPRVSRIWWNWLDFRQRPPCGPKGALVVKLFHGGRLFGALVVVPETFVVKPVSFRKARDKSSETFVGIGLEEAAERDPARLSVQISQNPGQAQGVLACR